MELEMALAPTCSGYVLALFENDPRIALNGKSGDALPDMRDQHLLISVW
jgi:hypothetical protein